MKSPTPQGGDEAARERSENLDAVQAEAQALPREAAVIDPPPAIDERPANLEPEPEAPIDKRAAILAARAAEKAARRARDEQGRFTAETDKDESTEAETQPADEPVVEPSVPALPEYMRQGEDGRLYVHALIDGIEQRVPADQYLADFQKTRTADQRLQQAAIERKQLEALRAPQGYQPPEAPGAGVMSPPQGATQESIPDDLWDKALIEGDVEARQRLAEHLRGVPQPTTDPSVIATQAAEQVRQQMQIENAIAQVSADPVNAMILGDEAMRSVANRYSETLQTSEPTLSPAENIARALEMTRASVARIAPAPPAPDNTRIAAKAQHSAATQATGGAARQAHVPRAPTLAETREASRNDLRARRGLV